jgi:hypothetical protein
MRRLEERLGIRLLTRTTRKISATAAGERLCILWDEQPTLCSGFVPGLKSFGGRTQAKRLPKANGSNYSCSWWLCRKRTMHYHIILRG